MSRWRSEPGLVLVWGAAAVAVAAAVVLAVVALLPAPTHAAAAQAGPGDTGLDAAETTLLAAEPMVPAAAPGFSLTDQHGRPSRLSDFRGRAVVLSFNDDRCTDICTLLAQDVVAADRDLGENRSKVAFVSVNANPYYPTPHDVLSWSTAHGLANVDNWTYDTGSAAQLASVAHEYGEQVKLDPRTRSIEHGTDLVFIDPSGNERLIGIYGTETADTAAFGRALADAAVSLLPSSQRLPVTGSAAAIRCADENEGASSTPEAGCPATSSLLTAGLPRLGGGAPVRAVPHQYTVITFFASTCTVCRTELPGIEKEYAATRKNVGYVGVDVADQPSAALELMKQTGVTYPVAVDRSGTTAAAYGVTGLPYTVILDPSGAVVTTHPGLLTADQLDYLLDVLPGS